MKYTGQEKLKLSDMKKYVGTKILIEPEGAGHGIYTPSVYEIE